MAVSTAEARKTYNGDGVSVNFTTPYFLSNSDLKVYVDGTLKTITTDYSVSGAGTPAGGTVSMVVAPITGTGNVVIVREPDQLQSSQLPSNDPFPSKTVETALDKLTMLIQRLFDKTARTLSLSDSDSSSVSLTLPAASALKFFRWNSSANAIENVDIASLGGVVPSEIVPQTSGTGSAVLPKGTTAQRDGTPVLGYMRYNQTLSQFEGYGASGWGAIGGGGQMLGAAATKCLSYNAQTIDEDLTVATGTNAYAAGPITINTGRTVTVSDGCVLTVI